MVLWQSIAGFTQRLVFFAILCGLAGKTTFAEAKSADLSLFEKYWEAVHGKIPNTFEDLVQDYRLFLNKKANLKVPPISLDYAFSRSPEKEFADVDSPRKLRAASPKDLNGFQVNDGRDEPNITLFGHAEKQGQTQIISPISSGVYDFLEIRRSPGMKPQLIHSDRAVCIQCHQNGSSTLSRSDWDESGGSIVMFGHHAEMTGKSFQQSLIELWNQNSKNKIQESQLSLDDAQTIRLQGDFEIPVDIALKFPSLPHREFLKFAEVLGKILHSKEKELGGFSFQMQDIRQAMLEAMLSTRYLSIANLIAPESPLSEADIRSIKDLAQAIYMIRQKFPSTSDQEFLLFAEALPKLISSQRLNGNAPAFDSIVREGNKWVQRRRILDHLDATAPKLRPWLALLSVLNESELLQIAPEFSKQLESVWPKQDFAYPSSVLLDRQPLQSPEKGGQVITGMIKDKSTAIANFITRDATQGFEPLKAYLHGEKVQDWIQDPNHLMIAAKLYGPEVAQFLFEIATRDYPILFNEFISSKQDFEIGQEEEKNTVLGSFELVKSVATDRIADPRSKRPLQGGIPKILAASLLGGSHLRKFWNWNTEVVFDQLDLAQKKSLFLESPQVAEYLAKHWPPEPQFLNEVLTHGKKANESVLKKSESCPPDVVEKIFQFTNDQAALKMFNLRCAECHRSSIRAPILPLDSSDKLRNWSNPKTGVTVEESLSSGSMPPPGARKDLSPAERQALMDWLILGQASKVPH